MRKYLFPLILIVSVMFFWPDKNPIVVTRIARIILCSFILAPCITAIFLFDRRNSTELESYKLKPDRKLSNFDYAWDAFAILLLRLVEKINVLMGLSINWLSLLLVWLGLTTTYNILFGFLAFNTASIEMLFFLSLVLMFYLVQRLNIETNIIIKTISYMVIFQAGLGVFQYATGIYFPFQNAIGKSMTVGFLDNTLNFATFLTIGLPFVFSLHWLAGLFVLYAIVLSGSLTAVLASVVGICIFYRSKKFIIIGVVLLLVFSVLYKTQLLTLSSSSIVTRYSVWSESIKISVNKPLTGFGIGNYRIIMPQYMQQKQLEHIGNNELWDNPSNDYVRGVFEVGFLSLIFIFGFIYTMIKRYYHLRLATNDSRIYFSSFISILVLCMGYSLFLNPTNIIWAVIVIALLNSELNRREEKCCF